VRGRRRLRAVPDHPAVPLNAAASPTPRAFSARDYPADPYPGARPDFSFVLDDDGCGRPIEVAEAFAGYGDRAPLLTYGSNPSPGKIAWLRAELGLREPVIVLRARCSGLAAVWAAGLRVVDDQRPATLTAMPGAIEQHAVWLVTPGQLEVLDVCEGRGARYQLAHVHTGTVELDDGTTVVDPLAYVGLADVRMPLLVDGRPVRCMDVPQSEARHLVGTAAGTTGLLVTSVG
jgi:hypothetical protein